MVGQSLRFFPAARNTSQGLAKVSVFLAAQKQAKGRPSSLFSPAAKNELVFLASISCVITASLLEMLAFDVRAKCVDLTLTSEQSVWISL